MKLDQAAAFFLIYRAYRDKGTPDAEVTRTPSTYRRMAVKAVKMRLRFLPYLRSGRRISIVSPS